MPGISAGGRVGRSLRHAVFGLPWILAAPVFLPAAAEETVASIEYETVSGAAVRNACDSVRVGPEVEVMAGARLRMQAPRHGWFGPVAVRGQAQVFPVCLPAEEFAGFLYAGADYGFCIPPQEFPLESGGVQVGTATLCAASLCGDGLTEGCAVDLTATAAMFDAGTWVAEISVEGEETTLDLALDLGIGPGQECVVDFANFSGDMTAGLYVVDVCPAPHAEIVAVNSFDLASTYDLGVSSCPSAPYLSALAGLIDDFISDSIRTALWEVVEEEVQGFWICKP